jgi:hypothetical protein
MKKDGEVTDVESYDSYDAGPHQLNVVDISSQ